MSNQSNSTAIPKDSQFAPENLTILANENKEILKEAKDKLENAISKLILIKPLFGVIFLYLNKIQDNKIPTMGVGAYRRVDLALYYNPDFVLSLSNIELRAVLQHEALHILLHHLIRREHRGSHYYIDNLAADMAINSYITSIPQWAILPNKKPFDFPEHNATEWYYEEMLKNADKYFDKNKENNSFRIKGSGGSNNSDNGDSNDSLDKDFKEKGLMGDHSRWDECEEDIIDKKLRNIAKEAINAQHKQGWSNVGTELAKAIIEANKPIVNWKKEVKYFINKFIKIGKTSTRSRLNRREHSIKNYRESSLKNVYFNPGTTKDYMSKILVAIDVSGSVSDDEISLFLSEINGMYTHAHIDVCMFDTALCGEVNHISKKITNYEIKGRGGTDFTPALRFGEENNYNGIICMSDGIFPIPERNNYNMRVLWCFTNEVSEPNYGKMVKLNLKK